MGFDSEKLDCQVQAGPTHRPWVGAGSALTGLATTSMALALAFVPAPLRAAEVSVSQQKAANVARIRAESLNGGLKRYVSAQCMHERGGGSCMVRANADGFRFEFLGGAPGWQTLSQKATVETKILVSPDGSKVKQVIYNGAPK